MFSETVPSGTPLSLKVAVPVGTPVPADVTAAVNTTLWPHTDGFCEDITIVVVGEIGVKLAVTECGPFMVMVCGLVVPERSPEKPVKLYPAAGVAVITTGVPELNQPPAVTDPPASGLALVVRLYCVVKLAV